MDDGEADLLRRMLSELAAVCERVASGPSERCALALAEEQRPACTMAGALAACATEAMHRAPPRRARRQRR